MKVTTRWILSFSFLSIGVMGSDALGWEKEPFGFNKNNLVFDSSFEFFKTEGNYDAEGGSFTSFDQGQYYQFFKLDFASQFAWSSRWQSRFGLSLVNAESYDGNLTRTTSEVSELFTSLQYRLFASPVHVIPEIYLSAPVSEYSAATDSAMTGEGVYQAEGRLWLMKKLGLLHLFGFIGYRHLTDGKASLMPYQASGEIEFQHFYFGGGVEGYETVVEDEETATPQNRVNVNNRVNGGSLKFNSINPKLLSANGWLGFRSLNSWDLRLVYNKTLNGSNAAEGQSLIAYLAFHFDFANTYMDRGNTGLDQPTSLDRGDEEEFTPAEPDYDEEVFQPREQRRESKKTKKRRRPQPVQPKKSEQQLLDEAMKSLE